MINLNYLSSFVEKFTFLFETYIVFLGNLVNHLYRELYVCLIKDKDKESCVLSYLFSQNRRPHSLSRRQDLDHLLDFLNSLAVLKGKLSYVQSSRLNWNYQC